MTDTQFSSMLLGKFTMSEVERMESRIVSRLNSFHAVLDDRRCRLVCACAAALAAGRIRNHLPAHHQVALSRLLDLADTTDREDQLRRLRAIRDACHIGYRRSDVVGLHRSIAALESFLSLALADSCNGAVGQAEVDRHRQRRQVEDDCKVMLEKIVGVLELSCWDLARPAVAVPDEVVDLAEMLYGGVNAVVPPLANALLALDLPEYAEHLLSSPCHPCGCWVIDSLRANRQAVNRG